MPKTKDLILEGLNPNQKEAVTHTRGPLLIIAGAGTGKTTVITRRIANLINKGLARPEEILALTFTDKAALEMQERVDVLVPYGFTDTWIMTFHAFGDRVLRENALEVGLSPDFKVLTRPETAVFFRENLFSFPLKHYRPLSDPTKFIASLITLFSRAKDEDVSVEEFSRFAEGLKEKAAQNPGDAALKEEAAYQGEIAVCYQKYQELLLKNAKVDFGNQFYLALQLFRDHPRILRRYQQQFKYLLIDEFQDTNYAQFELVKLLSGKDPNLTVVADDDQCVPAGTLVETASGKKRIADIIPGQKVITAVGRGYVTTSPVTKIFRNKKTVRLLTFHTEGGNELTVTDNHKMFCFVPPSLGKKDLYYVYLMWRQGLGWRLGVTNDLAGRLRLERSADKIIGIRCCATEEEASFYEVLYSLKYGIPTVCFMMREDIFVSGPWLERLYQEIDTQKAATKLANDFGIDLNSHHFCLGAVVRGNKARIKIKLELCFRKNTLKQPRGKLLKNPNVLHLVSLETSDAGIISKLKAAGFALRKTKKGMGWKKSSVDIQKLGAIADRLQKITNGIIEYKFRVGTRNITHGAALVMPASNVLRGHYLPVYRKGRILYERIAKVTSQIKTLTVYDLEIARTHNFIANGVVVHNSIYKWRGAAVSNILNFDSTYPKAKKISLTQNYRSTQKILDSAYQLIQQNNPDRFEVKANINKRLKGATVAGEPIKHLHFDSVSSEADAVAEVIAKKIESKKFHYNDFAILVRSNSDAEPFLRSLNMRGIPWRFSGSQGLYTREEIRLGIAFLKIIANPSDSLSLFYLCNSPLYALPIVELTQCMHYCRRRNEPLFFVLRRARQIEEFRDFPEDFFQAAEKLIAALEGYLKDAKNLTAGRLLYSFLSDSGYLKALAKEATAENEEKLKNLAEFFDMVRNFEMVAHEDRVMYFVNYLEMLIEAGDDPATAQAEMDVDAVNVLTIHKAKGLEFTVVFLVGLVKGRFPLPHRHQALELPEKLIKDILPSGDFHIQEERRLFYVGMTRAKKELYLTSAVDYGTERARKISPFVYEALGTKAEEESRKASPLEKIGRCAALSKPAAAAERPIDKDGILTLSYYQVDDYLTCPLKYKYVHVLRVPIMIHHSVLYGKALHDAVQFYHQRKIKGEAVSKDEVLAAFENSFKPEGFLGREHLEQRLTAGREAIGRFFRQQEQVKIIPKLVEKDFSFVLGQNRIIGRWDRIDERKEGVVIVDFKSSQIHKQKDADTHTKESLQLAIYCLAYQNIFNKLPDFQELHFLESGLIGRFKPEAPRLKKAEEEIAEAAEGVRIRDYTAKPSAISCNYCPYNLICPSAWRRPR